jgi:hypothetical protein
MNHKSFFVSLSLIMTLLPFTALTAEPAEVPGRVVEFDAGEGVETGSSMEGGVKYWESVAGGINASQPMDLRQGIPVADGLNGRPGIRFKQGAVMAANDLLVNAGDMSVVIVHASEAADGTNQYFVRSNLEPDTGDYLSVLQAGPTGMTGFFDGENRAMAKQQTGVEVLVWVFKGEEAKLYRNGVLVGSSPYKPSGIGGGVSIAHHYRGILGTLAIYDHALTDEERSRVEAPLLKKYSIKP